MTSTQRIKKQVKMEKDVRDLINTFAKKANQIHKEYALKLSDARVIEEDGHITLDVTFSDELGGFAPGPIFGTMYNSEHKI